MIGNLLSNIMVKELVDAGELIIEPFDEKLLQLTHYPLSPREILHWEGNSDEIIRFDLNESGDDYIFRSGEYAMVTVLERIVLPDGITGRFIPMSGLIEKGFGLTVGKLDPHYGDSGEEIRFGIYNLRGRPNAYDYTSPLAWIEFFDLRGLKRSDVSATGYDELIRHIRKSNQED